MKQLLFLLLFPCLALAQYQGNGNQKITLGEQTTADGLIYRGVLGDTALITPLSDTSAYIILDTANHRFYNYNRATNVWSVAGGGTSVTTFSAGTTGLTPSTATSGAVTLGGTLAVANGGTGSTTKNFVDLTTSQTIAGTKSFTGRWYGVEIGVTRNGSDVVGSGPWIRLTNTAEDRQMLTQLNASNGLAIWAFNGSTWNTIYTLSQSGVVTIANLAGSGSRAVNAAADGTLSAASSILIKENVENINYGLSDVLKLKPVIFNYIDRNKWGEGKDLGFVAEDVMNVIPEATGVMNNSDIYFDLQKLVPVLTKAIQEQQVLIKALEQRIINLENK